MAKCVISIGYRNFVIDSDKGVQLLDILADAEIYEEKYRGNSTPCTYHVYSEQDNGTVSLRLLPQGFYSLAKLAGKPVKEN